MLGGEPADGDERVGKARVPRRSQAPRSHGPRVALHPHLERRRHPRCGLLSLSGGWPATGHDGAMPHIGFKQHVEAIAIAPDTAFLSSAKLNRT